MQRSGLRSVRSAPSESSRTVPTLEALIRAVQRSESLSSSDKQDQIRALLTYHSRAGTLAAGAPTLRAGTRPGTGAAQGCEHYSRKCWLKAACCDHYYPCRRCHDAVEGHEIDRHATEFVVCVVCGEEQCVAASCVRCGVRFAKYFCVKCKFFDDDVSKDIYHCDDCGICRVGKGLGIDHQHCNGCNACLPIDLKEHPCRERSMDSNCPICWEHLGTSTERIALLLCGHSLHVECLKRHLQVSHVCPLCSRSLADMTEYYKQLDARIKQDVIPAEYANRVSQVLCHDCGKKCIAPFHFHFHKCTHCGVYNTRVLKQFDLPPNEKADLVARCAAVAAIEGDVSVHAHAHPSGPREHSAPPVAQVGPSAVRPQVHPASGDLYRHPSSGSEKEATQAVPCERAPESAQKAPSAEGPAHHPQRSHDSFAASLTEPLSPVR